MHPRPPAGVLAGSADEVETQFYEALARGDVERVMALWADDDDIVCVQPDGVRLVGAPAVRAGFTALLAGGGLAVQPQQPMGRLTALGAALHHGLELQPGPAPADRAAPAVWRVVSHCYIKTPAGWRLAARHASAAAPGVPAAVPTGSPGAADTLH